MDDFRTIQPKKKKMKPFTEKLILNRSILSDINYGTSNVIYQSYCLLFHGHEIIKCDFVL